MIEITPIEFERDSYREKVRAGECIVWYKDEYPIHWVEKSKYYPHHYDLHHDDGGDYSCRASVRPYDICLKVEDTSDLAELRNRVEQLAAQIVEQCPDDSLLWLRQHWQMAFSWQTKDPTP